jgi:hypothetical protein
MILTFPFSSVIQSSFLHVAYDVDSSSLFFFILLNFFEHGYPIVPVPSVEEW